MERKCRLGTFVAVDVLVAEPVAAAPGCEVVERAAQVVAAEEPVEREPRADTVLARRR